MEKHFGSSRFVYNKLHIKSTLYDKFMMRISVYDLKKHIIALKEIYPWLSEVNSQTLQQASINLDRAIANFSNPDFGILKKE